MPWLTATAFLHSVMVLQRTGHLRTWTLILGLSTFLLTLLGTFMTRSGVFNSVHSFTQSDIGPVFLGFIAVCFVFSVLLLAIRDNAVITSADDATARPMGSAPISREFTILLQNLVFAVFTFTVLLGVLYPLITEQLWEKRVSVGEPYFDRVALPLGLTLVFLMGVGPALPWGRMSPDAAARKLFPAVGGAGVAALLAAGLGVRDAWPLATIALCGFAFVANFNEYLEPVRARVVGRREAVAVAMAQVFARGRRRFGGHVAHFGVLMAVVAIAMSSAYKAETDLVLKPGQSGALGVWTFTYTGARRVEEPQRSSLIASFELAKNGARVATIEPKLNQYPRMREPVGTPAVYTTAATDVYVSLLQVADDGGTVSIRAMTMPLVVWLWVSAAVIALGSLLVMVPGRRGASVTASAPLPAAEAAK
jgi:cytochrome c-type biogenesis protein CcmF